MDKIKITFSPIDAKEGPVVGLDHYYARNATNANVLARAQLEYLQELKKLQSAIVAKFEPLLISQSSKDEVVQESLGNWRDFRGLYYS